MTSERDHRESSNVARNRAALAIHTKFGPGHRLAAWLLEWCLQPLKWLLRADAAGSPDKVGSILVVEQGHLGDVILLTPFLRSLRQRFPHAHIALLGRPGLRGLLDVQNLVDELVPIQIPWTAGLPRWKAYNPCSLRLLKFIREVFRLRRRHFDWAFVAGLGDIRHNLLLLLAGARRRVAYGFAGGGSFLTDVVEPDLSRVHHAELSLRLLEHLGISANPPEKLLSLAPEEVEFGSTFLAENNIDKGGLVVGIHPKAGAPLKEWGEDRFREVAEQVMAQFGGRVIWFTDPSQPLGSESVSRPGIVRAALPLRQFLAVLSCCDVLICNDSGPMHMAAALGVPVVAIFGPELAEWYGPLGVGHQVVVRQAMWCRPCWRNCRFAEPYCLRLISVREVMQAVTEAVGVLAREQNVAGARP